jgi:hypothetical protein
MLASILALRPARSIADVVAVMVAIDQALPDDDGVKWFNHLYLKVTRAVEIETAAVTTFRDPAFLARLAVVFANLYLDAAAAGLADPASAPPAWRPLFDCRRRPLERIQFALAGMNAHINRDLPLSLVRTYKELGGSPAKGDGRHTDFLTMNEILARVEDEVKPELAVGLVGVIDRVGGDKDDAMARWSVRAARDAAWTSFEVLWALDRLPTLRTEYFAKLDKMTGFAGRGLLVPTR